MRSSRWHWMTLAAACLAAGVSASAQQPAGPEIGYVYPAGAPAGATLTVFVGGRQLNGVSRAMLSGPGAEAAVLGLDRPLTIQQFNDLRERLAELRKDKKPKDAATLKEIAEAREKMRSFIRNANPAIAEIASVRITLAPEAAPGRREIRLLTPAGLTNPLAFFVAPSGGGEEFAQTPAHQVALPPGQAFRRQYTAAVPAREMDVRLPAMVNGQIMPGGVDRFRFTAAAGQRIVVAVAARALVPYLADAVPGWFQAVVSVRDSAGRQLACADHFRFDPDPVVCCTIPADGQYVLEIHDSIYRGREDFVYRIAIGELPFVTERFPLGGPAGAKTTVRFAGWNLPDDARVREVGPLSPGLHQLFVQARAARSNPVPFAAGTLDELAEREPNDSPARAQQVALPRVVNGRIDRPGDVDCFRLDGRGGDELVAEVVARRLDSPLDSVLRVTDAAGRLIAANDDYPDKSVALQTHHADSYIRVKLSADGPCFVQLADVQGRGGSAFAYRLRLDRPRPDFELRVCPSAVNVRGWAIAPLTVFAIRRDGFDGPIDLSLAGAPAGYVLGGGRVPAGQDQVRLTLIVAPGPITEPVPLRLEGRATIGGAAVVRPAVPADDRMQAFAYRHLVPADGLWAAQAGRAPPRAAVRILSPPPVRIPAGGEVRIRVGMRSDPPYGRVEFELDDPPDGIAISRVVPQQWACELVLAADAAKARPGTTGNLLVNVFVTPRPPAATQPDAPRRPPPRRYSPGTLPAIPFQVVAPAGS